MREAAGIDVVTRLYDLADLPHLDRLVFSLMGQLDVASLRLHVMLQRFSFAEVQTVRDMMRDLRQMNDAASVTLHNWDNPAPRDLRLPLLNWGLEVARGRYLTCLDVHEQLCPHACATLLARLRGASTAAMALGGVALQPVLWWGDVILPVPEREAASVAATFVMIDRSRVAAGDCVFRSDDRSSEIEEFIDRLGASYDVDTTCESRTLVIRTLPSAGAAAMEPSAPEGVTAEHAETVVT